MREVSADSHSRSALFGAVLYGPFVRGEVLGSQDLRFADYVVTMTRPGAPRMPNGIECASRMRARERVAIGGGRLVVGRTVVSPGPEWDPMPLVSMPRRALPAGPEPLLRVIASEASGAMSLSDCALAGYVAGIVLMHGHRERAARLAHETAARANPLTATLIRHAALGEVPEPVHGLLAGGQPRELLSAFGAAGQAWLRGLISAGYPMDAGAFRGRAAGCAP